MYIVCVNSIVILDCLSPTREKKEILQHIQRSFFANVLNYITDTKRICIINHYRSECCTHSCIPLNLSKFNFNQIFLSVKNYLFFFTFALIKRVISKTRSYLYTHRIPIFGKSVKVISLGGKPRNFSEI